MEHTIGWNSNPGTTPPKPNFLGLTLELYYQLLYIIRWKSTLKKWKERSMIKRQAFLLFHLLSPPPPPFLGHGTALIEQVVT